MIEQTNTITESIKLKSGQVWDGKGQTYHLKAGWDFCPFLVENVQDVVLKNFNLIVTQPDKLKRVSGLVGIIHSKKIKVENVKLQGGGKLRGTNNQIPLMLFDTEDVEVSNSEISWCRKGHNVDIQQSTRCKIINNDVHHAYYDGIKHAACNKESLIAYNHSHHNGSIGREKGAVGDGLDLTQGGPVDVIGNNFDYNDNGITFKYAAWNYFPRKFPNRWSVYGVNIIGGSLKNNGNGLFAQGFAGSNNTTGSCDEKNAPHPMGFNVQGVLAQDNSYNGFVIGHGSWNLDKCIAYRNKQHGVSCTEYSTKCNIRDLLSVANGHSNMNMWGSDNDVDHARCYGIDIFRTNAADWKKAKVISKYGINHQWKPARGKHHGIYRRCFNQYSSNSNGKPQHLPESCWVEPYDA